jgi:alanine dehydrogenase
MEVLVIGHHQVSQLLSMGQCIDLMEETFKTLARGEALVPLRHRLPQPDGKGIVSMMPSYIDTPRVIGLKAFTVFPGNQGTRYEAHQGAILVFECDNGRLMAIVEAGSITSIRTGAVSGVATRQLAKEGAANLAILGSGTQAAIHIESMMTVRPIRNVKVWSRNWDHAVSFADRQTRYFGLPIQAAHSTLEAIQDADIICTTTWATEPILEGNWLTPGTHINAIGSSSPAYREIDSNAVVRSRFYVDQREAVMAQATEFRAPKEEARISDAHIRGELGELLLGKADGRENDDDITVFKAVGLAVADLAAAHFVYERAMKEHIGTWIEFGGERLTVN